jgi:bifunctional DNA-binding transcriptional regulator/antitoxin component of YhaV-PrlF toxin-antitoxin module
MTSLTVNRRGEITLPEDLRQRYGLTPETSLRIVEVKNGILLVPLSDKPMSAELERELQEWQSLSLETWNLFPYEESAPETV